MIFLKAFLIGGLICVIGQILIDKTKLTPARILVMFVVIGCLLGGIGVYGRFAEFAGAGATIPLPGFGYLLARGVKEEVNRSGLLGVLTGGLKMTAAGISAAVLFGLLAAVAFNPKAKE
ncbi:MAG: stage V sporulation protein AE [Defluviitaleaceae bacterium]|nr:stage V sporulation protein AE [Defluviitaleaceae bacterium]MCL2836439.1 stage V sporulation protein AE [Defluviitaleaceae bacterium]